MGMQSEILAVDTSGAVWARPSFVRNAGAAVGFAALILYLAATLIPSNFLWRDFMTGTDSRSYVNLAGFSQGPHPSNFASGLRTPGYPLFLAAATAGELPRPGAIKAEFCGAILLRQFDDCATVVSRTQADVVSAAANVVLSYSSATAGLLQQAMVASRILFLLSIILLFAALCRWFHPLAAAASVIATVAVVHPATPTLLDFVLTESLFPSLFFLYVAATLVSLKSPRAIWVILASAIAGYIFLVRPAMLYVPIGHIALLALTVRTRGLAQTMTGVALALLPVIWVVFYSPVRFFASADHLSTMLRVGVLSDAETVSCVGAGASGDLLAAYVRSLASDPDIGERLAASKTYAERFFLLSTTNKYQIDLAAHRINNDPTIANLRTDGALSSDALRSMLQAASACNAWKDIDFSFQNVRLMMGLTSIVTPLTRPAFFSAPWVAWLCLGAIAAGVATLIQRRDGTRLLVAAMPIVLYLGTVFVVAIKQGGESRYILIVEPLFALGTFLCAAVVLEALLARARALLPRARPIKVGYSAKPTPIPAGGRLAEVMPSVSATR